MKGEAKGGERPGQGGGIPCAHEMSKLHIGHFCSIVANITTHAGRVDSKCTARRSTEAAH